LGNVIDIVRPWLNVREGRQFMRLAAANPQPFQLDVAATSSIPRLLPKISVEPAVAAQGTRRFMHAIQDTLRNKLKGTAISA
jgi:hypothetical protein